MNDRILVLNPPVIGGRSKSLNTENNELHIFGYDYSTPDGTGIRDYIHVMDIATGHLAAIKIINKSHGYQKINLGTGIGYSVLEFIKAFEKTIVRSVPFILANKRVGDVAVSYADPSLATSLMEWKAVYTLEDMCRDTWRWHTTFMFNK
jgi:UDP-glucose 4-epimerase